MSAAAKKKAKKKAKEKAKKTGQVGEEPEASSGAIAGAPPKGTKKVSAAVRKLQEAQEKRARAEAEARRLEEERIARVCVVIMLSFWNRSPVRIFVAQKPTVTGLSCVAVNWLLDSYFLSVSTERAEWMQLALLQAITMCAA